MKATLKQKTASETYHYEVVIDDLPREFSITYLDGLPESVCFPSDGLTVRETYRLHRLIADLIDDLDFTYKAAAYVESALIDEPEFSYFRNKVKFLEEV